MPTAQTIDEVIAALNDIIAEAKRNNDTSGYFAALYRRVTIRVKEGILNNEFENGARMEKLDVVFANRYLEAYSAWKNKEPVTASWQKAFTLSPHFWPIVLQHLLMGMNAHINLDLGIAANAVSTRENIAGLEGDFNKINTILSGLVAEVQSNLAGIWPGLKWLLKKTKGVDSFFVDFSMQLSREGAWKFANALAALSPAGKENFIAERDGKVAEKSKIVTNPGLIVRLVFGIIRLGERGSVAAKIKKLGG